ncbi:IPK1 [[Candida] subhashii]|uniref:Inositol-pentakisphosphate 2-kinase n=1 Tax=[Candida] subhashii TaxID=561895 RepID=A0A8J5QI25_9ASCO|nr:IPK1 [[Candida] subhashii]KAG7666029.1 IPK1 [[Candida] subhashii]
MELSKLTPPHDWVYFKRGAANILFKYIGPNDYFFNKLLRIRFSLILEIQLIVLTSEFVSQLDSRGHQLMNNEQYGLLIPNILYDEQLKYVELSKYCQLYYSDNNQVIFEIKPKWLYDNVSTNYCRNCSLSQYRGYQRHFCPLDLLYPETINVALDDIFSAIPQEVLSQISLPIYDLFKRYLQDPQNIFQKLKQYQSKSTQSILNLTSSEDVSEDLSLVMTLRDVGIFIKFEPHTSSEGGDEQHVTELPQGKYNIICNIYDLDLKSNLKYTHWIKVEQELQPIYNSHNENWKYCIRRDKLNQDDSSES